MLQLSSLLRLRLLAVSFLFLALFPPSFLSAQSSKSEDGAKDSVKVYRLAPMTVTVTRTAKNVFATAKPVFVLDRDVIRERNPNTVSDLFRELPGLDVTGVGANQTRPSIRGQRGQRILLLQDGMRLNNSRRQQDFGEIPALVDISSVERVEIVRGPASVLYGSDAIGGVVNVITRTPTDEGMRGWASYRHGTSDGQNKGAVGFSARSGRISLMPRMPSPAASVSLTTSAPLACHSSADQAGLPFASRSLTRAVSRSHMAIKRSDSMPALRPSNICP